jgi:hypothetical protein
MNDKDYTDLLSRHGVPVPPSWGGLIGSGGNQMYSLGGRWLKAGQKTPQGHTIDSLDPETGFLNLSYQGVPLMPLKMRDAVVQDYVPAFTQGGNSETEADDERMRLLFMPYKNPDGSFSVPTFGKQTFKSLEEAEEMVKTYGVKDRTGIDKFLKSFKERNIAGPMGTLSDFWNSTPEQQASGMKVFNNLTGDFTDMFKATPPPSANPAESYLEDPSVQLFGDDGFIK